MSFADAVDNDPEAYKNAMADIKAFEALQIKIFGTKKSELDSEMDKMKSISILNLKKLFEDSPELFVHAVGCECEQCRITKRAPDRG
jgi:hypothetical protein